MSRTAVSQVTEVLWKEHEAFAYRGLSGFEVKHSLLGIVDESLRV